MYISLPDDYAKRVEGLCGNFNGKAADDFSIDGMKAGSASEFGNYYRTENCPAVDDETNAEACEVCFLFHMNNMLCL